MRIVKNGEAGSTVTLVPTGSDEEDFIANTASLLEPGNALNYAGRKDDELDHRFCSIVLEFESFMLNLHGDSEADKFAVNNLRNICFFGTGQLIFLGHIEIDGKQSLLCTGSYCEKCEASMLSMIECEWRTCNACSEKCEHEYEEGAVHGQGVDIGVGQFCQKCGRGKPKGKDEKAKSQLQHHLAAEQKLGVTVIYKNTALSPTEIDYLQKIANAQYN